MVLSDSRGCSLVRCTQIPKSESPMIAKHQVELNVCRAYFRYVEQRKTPDDSTQDLLLVLQIYEWQLLRKSKRIPLKLDQLSTLKHGIRLAERIHLSTIEAEPSLMAGWYAGYIPNNQPQMMANLLCELILEFTKEIVANEALYPELKFAFDRERAQYRTMLYDAQEADKE